MNAAYRLLFVATVALSTGCASLRYSADIAAVVDRLQPAPVMRHVDALDRLGPRPASDGEATRATVDWLAAQLRALGLEVVENPVEVRFEQVFVADVRPSTDPDAAPQELEVAFDLPHAGRNAIRAQSDLLRAKGWLVDGYALRSIDPPRIVTVPNLIATIRGRVRPNEVVELSAHYDTVPNTAGADDNSSGVAALLEIARLLAATPTARTIRLCFFGAEEVGLRGSAAHVAAITAGDEELIGLINLDAVGFTAPASAAQRTPPGVPWFWSLPDEGNFVAVIGTSSSGWLGNLFEAAIDTYVPELRYYSANRIGGWFRDAERSDHAQYWRAGLPAIFITDTGEFRSPHYHRPSDVPETLDAGFLTAVARATLATALHLAQPIWPERGAPVRQSATPLPALDPSALQTEEDEWFGIYIDGQKAGWSHTRSGPAPARAGGARWQRTTRSRMHLSGAAGAFEITTLQEDVYQGDAPFLLLESVSRTVRGGDGETTRIVRRGQDLYIEQDRQPKGVIESADYGLADALHERRWLSTMPPIGTTLATRVLDTDGARLASATSRVLRRGASMVRGVPVHWVEIERTRPGDPEPETQSCDDRGRTWHWRMGAYELRREPRAIAQQLDRPVDLGLLGAVSLRPAVADIRERDALRLTAIGEGTRHLRDGPGQRVEARGPDHVVVLLAPRRLPLPADPASVRAATAARADLPESVHRLAANTVGDIVGENARVRRLVAFVRDHLEDDDWVADHPTLDALLAAGRGDCSDHARLLVALAQAAGTAARRVAGLLSEDGVTFHPHEWCEVAVDGTWWPVDPIFGRTALHAGYLRMGGDASVLLAPRMELRHADSP